MGIFSETLVNPHVSYKSKFYLGGVRFTFLMIPIRSHLKKLSSILGILPLLTLLTPDLDLTSEGAASVGFTPPPSVFEQ